MLEYARWKYVVILLVLLLSALYALPNIYPQDPSVQVTANRGFNVDAALRQRVEASLKKAGIATKAVEIGKDGNLLVRLPNPGTQVKAAMHTSRPRAWARHLTDVEQTSRQRLRTQRVVAHSTAVA